MPPARTSLVPARRLTVVEAAEAGIAVLEAGGEPALRTLAAQDELDPWLVADEPCSRGAYDAAAAFARAHEAWRHPYYWAAWVLWGLP